METIEVLKNLIKPELLILVPILIFLGSIIKKTVIKNKYIPFILTGISVALATIYVVATCGDTISYKGILLVLFTAITQGILVTALSVYGYENYKNIKKEEI